MQWRLNEWFLPIPRNYPGMGYISAQSQNPQACYNWFKAVAQRPDLLYGMPVQRDVLSNSSQFLSTQKSNFYQAYATVLESEAITFFPGRFANVSWQGDFVEHIWLDRAFDAYVLDGNDNLAENLAEAESFISEFRACLASDRTISDCARAVDPSLSSDSRIGS